MGLLSRAIGVRGQSGSGPERGVSTQNESRKDYLYPQVLFAELAETLNIRKGALFLKEAGDGCFYPMVIKGYDKTTTLRIRIPGDTIPAADGLYYSDSAAGFDYLRPYMSSREFGLLEYLWILPIKHGDEPFALLFISDSDLGPRDIRKILEEGEISVMSDYLFRSRRKFAALTHYALLIEYDELVDSLGEMIRENRKRNSSFVCFTLKVNELLDSMAINAAYVSMQFVRHDILKVLYQMVDGIGRLYYIDRDIAVFILYNRSIKNFEIIKHQIRLSLSVIFSDEILTDLKLGMALFPQDGEDAEILLNKILAA